VISLNLVLAGLRLGLKNRQVGEKWVADDCSYLCKGLYKDKTSKPQSMTTSNGSKTSWQSPQIKVIKSDYLQFVISASDMDF
jgi:hypothetical protein